MDASPTPTPEDQMTYLCACLFNSCLLVKAGLLSGLGPRRLAGCPSLVTLLSAKDLNRLKLRGLFWSFVGPADMGVVAMGAPYAMPVPTAPNSALIFGTMEGATMLGGL